MSTYLGHPLGSDGHGGYVLVDFTLGTLDPALAEQRARAIDPRYYVDPETGERLHLIRRTDDDRGWWLSDGSWITDNGLDAAEPIRTPWTLGPNPDDVVAAIVYELDRIGYSSALLPDGTIVTRDGKVFPPPSSSE